MCVCVHVCVFERKRAIKKEGEREIGRTREGERE